MAQLRSGHCSRLRGYATTVNPAADPTCPRCGGEPEDLGHWLQRCPATDRVRQEIFGGLPELGVLAWEPSLGGAFALRTLRR
jgi:hypothetical protein